MLRWTLLSFAGLFFALALLTVFRSPDWNAWQLALLAGEYGQFLMLGAAGVALGTVFTKAPFGARTLLGLTLCAAAAVLFLRPTFDAPRVAAQAKIDLDRIGAPATTTPGFSLAGYFRRALGPRVAVKTLRYTGELDLDFYPAVGRKMAPCVIVIHGGGWDSGQRSELADLNQWLAQHGYAVAAVSYRLAPDVVWPGQRDDVRAAIAFLTAQASQLRIDPKNFVLLGRSAGGQIAETVAYAEHDLAIRGVVGLYAPSDLRFAYKYSRDDDVLKSPALLRRYLGGAPESVGTNYDSATALDHVSRNSPPTLLIHGENDTLVWHRHSVRLEAVLEQAGVQCVFVSLPWATHAFDFNLSGPGGQITRYALERFLGKVTQAKK
jgi:acetyl esterase/lipase